MTRTPEEQLRALLGEAIPAGGSDSDTMFSTSEISDLIEKGTASNFDFPMEAAAYYGWLEKMANYANLVTVNEGNAMRELTELHRNAQRMVDRYIGYVPTPGRGRARVGRISRDRTY
jgi:hypothetical protein